MAIQDLLVFILSGLYKIPNPRSEKVSLSNLHQNEEQRNLENSKKFCVYQVEYFEHSKFLNEITNQVH